MATGTGFKLVIECNEHAEKAKSPILITLSGMVTEESFTQRKKA